MITTITRGLSGRQTGFSSKAKSIARASAAGSILTGFQLLLGIVGLPLDADAAAALQFVSRPNSSQAIPAGGSSDSEAAVISAGGRYVLFESMAANLVVISNPPPASGLQPRRQQIFLRDRTAGTTTLVSATLGNNSGGNGDSFTAGISMDGQFALYVSYATNLVAGDSNNTSDVFLRNLTSNTNILVSVRTSGGSGNGASRNATMTPDARYIAFVSGATNLVAGDTNGIPDVFVRDRIANTTVRVSVGAAGTGVGSEAPLITPDGRYVAFYSTATNLVPGITNKGQIYVRDLVSNTTTLASTNALTLLQSTTGATNGFCFSHQISDDGRYVSFAVGTNSFLNESASGLVLRQDLLTGNTDLIHTNANVPYQAYEDIRSLCMTPDGRYVAFIANTNVGSAALCVYRWDAQTGNTALVSGRTNNTVGAAAFCQFPQMDASGRYVAFNCSDLGLVTNALSGAMHLYLRDVQTGTTRLLNVGPNHTGYEVSTTTAPSLSTDGQLVVFDAPDGGLVASDNNRANDAFARNWTSATTELISGRHASLPALTGRSSGNTSPLPFQSSSNGRFVVFTADGDDLVANDTNGLRDVIVRDLFLGTNLLVSAATNGFSANGHSFDPVISDSGRFVAFTSSANNIVAGDSNGLLDIFLCDLQTGTRTLVSVKTNANAAGNSEKAYVSPDGRYVLFRSEARNLVTATTTSINLYQRDMQSGITRALTLGGAGTWSPTPDGSRIAFIGLLGTSGAFMQMYVWNTATASRIYTNAIQSPRSVAISPNGLRVAYIDNSGATTLYTTHLVSNTTATVSSGTFPSYWIKLSQDGRYLAYATTAAKANDSNGVSDVWLYDCNTAATTQVCRAYNSNLTPSGASDFPEISPDGRFIAYRTFASNAAANDSNSACELMLYDRIANTNYLLSRSVLGNFTANNFTLYSKAFSGDSQTLTFSTWASDLLPGDYNSGSDVVQVALPTSVFRDSDNDGMDDTWETAYFGNVTHNGLADSDGDGMKDLWEFQTLTNPTNANSAFAARLSPGAAPTITWPAMAWRSYQVENRDDLGGASWQPLTNQPSLTGPNGTATDTSPHPNQRLYRVRMNP
jgi:hypothetical protein